MVRMGRRGTLISKASVQRVACFSGFAKALRTAVPRTLVLLPIVEVRLTPLMLPRSLQELQTTVRPPRDSTMIRATTLPTYSTPMATASNSFTKVGSTLAKEQHDRNWPRLLTQRACRIVSGSSVPMLLHCRACAHWRTPLAVIFHRHDHRHSGACRINLMLRSDEF